jgi:hypothetical protein
VSDRNPRINLIRMQTTCQSNYFSGFERIGGGFQKNQPEKLKNIGLYLESSE